MRSIAHGLLCPFLLVLAPLVTASSQSVASPASVSRAIDTPHVRVLVTRSPGGTTGQVVLLVRVEAEGLTLGSYSGSLRFDPAMLAIDSASAVRDGSRFVNAGEAERGLIRFAGFTTNGFAGTEAVRLVGRLRSLGTTAYLTSHVDVAGSLEGKAVPAASLRGTRTSVSDP